MLNIVPLFCPDGCAIRSRVLRPFVWFLLCLLEYGSLFQNLNSVLVCALGFLL